ncbi:MAG: hypothetical protein DWQ34_20480 [Planctomycetota bacterium]|nr:MAG: hypothetical protein DWQ34_20480 [Planctomycetota bacterium]REK29769.1 MAG: hypothetical protein DWQ41_03815 [Planctomycetota bacterium]REK30411.1 MAG: hypothetical protein DWQ45_21220 [Planctomycetota bacterium]
MQPIEIREHLRNASKQPIRIHLGDGTAYEVRHPDMAWVSQTVLVIGVLPSEEGIPYRAIHVDPFHVTRIEPIDQLQESESGSKGNGR